MRGVRCDRGGADGLAGRSLTVKDHERRKQRGSNGAAATERRGLREARDDWSGAAASLCCVPIASQTNASVRMRRGNKYIFSHVRLLKVVSF